MVDRMVLHGRMLTSHILLRVYIYICFCFPHFRSFNADSTVSAENCTAYSEWAWHRPGDGRTEQPSNLVLVSDGLSDRMRYLRDAHAPRTPTAGGSLAARARRHLST